MDTIRIQDVADFPMAPLMAYGPVTDAQKPWIPEESWRGAIVWGLPLPNDVVDGIVCGPTPRYAATYVEWNRRLDDIAKQAVTLLNSHGILSKAISASEVIDQEHQRGEVSHRHLAASLGRGWIGKHGLLVTLKWGAALRLVTVLVDHPVESSPKWSFEGCGSCEECIEACPVSALNPPITPDMLARCNKLLNKHKNNPDIGHHVCGICVRACRDAVCKGYNDTGNV